MALRGSAAVVFGAGAFVIPETSFEAIGILFGVYALVDGNLNVIAAVTVPRGERPWLALLVEGFVSILAGLVVFLWPDLDVRALLLLMAWWAVLIGVFEMPAAIRLRGVVVGEKFQLVAGVSSALLGTALFVMFRGRGALVAVWLLGTYGVLFGLMLLGIASRLRNHELPVGRHVVSQP